MWNEKEYNSESNIKMDDEDQMILDNIDEFVNDEAKIVSYKWLSLSLSLNVNKATKLLGEYLKKSNNELDVIYFVGGRKNDGLNLTFQYKLTKQHDLDKVKETFEEVTSCHVYSIQKSCITDSSVLYTNHVDVINEHLSDINKCSAIQCDSVKNLNETLAKRIQHQNVPVTNGFHGVNEVEDEPPKPQQSTKNQDIKKQSPNKTVSSNKQGSKNKKETSTKSFFGKAADKKPNSGTTTVEDTPKLDKQTEKSENKVVKEADKKKPKVKKKNISSAFAKSKNKKVDTSKEVDSNKRSEIIDCDKEDKEEIQIDEEKENHIEDEKCVSKSRKDKDKGKDDLSPVKEKSPIEKSKKRKTHVIDSGSNDDDLSPVKEKPAIEKSKKSKTHVIDSESDDDDFEKFLTKSKDPTYESPVKEPVKASKPKPKDESDVEEVDVIEPTPEPVKKKKRRRTEKEETKSKKGKKEKPIFEKAEKPQKPVSKEIDENKDNTVEVKSGGKRRGRRMVMKSKQYLDEDGFMVTRKECESESFSEESDTEMSEEKIKSLTPERKKEVEKKKVVIDLEKKTKAHLSKPKTQASLMNFFKKK